MATDLSFYTSEKILLYGYSGLLFAALMSMYFVPALRKLATAKNFTDSPSARKSHSLQVPFLGGVAVYLSAAIPIATLAIFSIDLQQLSSKTLLLGSGALTLLLVGVIDDIIGMKALSKLAFQIVIASIVLYILQFNIGNMNGLFGLYELPHMITMMLSLFVYVVFMNMLNLIDGIDGLASGLSLIAFTFFAYIAYSSESTFNMLICMSSIGSLLPFIYHNMFSDKKIFLGDNGSLVLGFTLGFLALELLTKDNSATTSALGVNTSLVLMSLFSFPLVDTLRVFMIRMSRNRSPFSPDKNHIHHHLLRLGLSHRQATSLILFYTVLITFLSILLVELNINFAFAVLLSIAVFCVFLPTFLENKINGSITFINRN